MLIFACVNPLEWTSTYDKEPGVKIISVLLIYVLNMKIHMAVYMIFSETNSCKIDRIAPNIVLVLASL